MSRHVLACHTSPSRPGKIVVQDGGPMPECRDLQSGNRGYYEWIEVPTVKEVARGADQIVMLAVVLAVVMSSALTLGLQQVVGFLRRRKGAAS